MKGNGNSFSTLAQKLYFYLIPTQKGRTKYIIKHKDMFHSVGENFFFQPRKFPADPERIAFGNNVKIAANVAFVTHDVCHFMLNAKYDTNEFVSNRGCIEIGDNVMIGSGVIILPNVRIGNNVVIGAGAIVTKDIPDNSIAAGIPCRVVGDFDKFAEKRKTVVLYDDVNKYWDDFYAQRGTK